MTSAGWWCRDFRGAGRVYTSLHRPQAPVPCFFPALVPRRGLRHENNENELLPLICPSRFGKTWPRGDMLPAVKARGCGHASVT